MKSQNYTWEMEKESLAGVYVIEHFRIIDLDGKVIANAYNEKAADLIVTALNGNAG